MAVSVLYMPMSLDGYIADPTDRLGGDDGARLHHWALNPDGESFLLSWPAGAFIDEINATGAVLAGRRTVEIVDQPRLPSHPTRNSARSDRPSESSTSTLVSSCAKPVTFPQVLAEAEEFLACNSVARLRRQHATVWRWRALGEPQVTSVGGLRRGLAPVLDLA